MESAVPREGAQDSEECVPRNTMVGDSFVLCEVGHEK